VTKSSGIGTTHIGVRPATNVLHGIRFAAASQRPLSLAATINWDRLGLSDGAARDAFRELRRKVRRRWTYLKQSKSLELGPFDDVGSHENPAGHFNTHWLIRVPAFFTAEFKRTVTRFLKKIVCGEELGQALHFRAAPTPGSFAKYMLKGVDPDYAAYFHMQAQDQGFVVGRGRTFVGRAIGQSARRQAGWKRPRRPKA
jgi:hypothetical protein